MREFMNITKALADENRVRALLALRHGELCVCQITEFFGLAPSTMSKHLSVLYQAGLLEVPVMLSVCRICNQSRAWHLQSVPAATRGEALAGAKPIS
jgi:DNA-binding transcriptional ArsR family regulator